MFIPPRCLDYPSLILTLSTATLLGLLSLFPLLRQGRHLVALISMALACVTDDEKFNRALEKLTKTHNELGVKAYEYALVAETHFWTMRRVCGEAYGTSQHGNLTLTSHSTKTSPWPYLTLTTPTSMVTYSPSLPHLLFLYLGIFSSSVSVAIWTKIISRMLKVMVPSAVAYEIHSGGMHVEREKGNHTFSENISFELTVLYLLLSQRTLILLPLPKTPA